jgi:formylglycine-generating enzyme required for sulfatase activity
MHLGFFASLLLIWLALTVGSAQAQVNDEARKKCVEFGFKEKTPSHDNCMKQFLQATGSQRPPSKPTPSAQMETKFWDAAMAAGNKEAFAAYLDSYPRGRYVGPAKINMARLEAATIEQLQALADAAEKLAAERAAFEGEQKVERERAAAMAAEKLATERAAVEVEQKVTRERAAAAQTVAAAARRAEVAPGPGQIIKDCADCPTMVVIPAGRFEMGSILSRDEQPIHSVNVSGFLLGRTEVTQGQWKAVMGSNPSRFNQCGEDCPVEQVSWNEAQDFARRLSMKTGKSYRLPSEAEWEYAARAGGNTKWNSGDSENQLSDHGWFTVNSLGTTHRVAEKKPNAFGLFDMHGNVLEWVEDCTHSDYNGAPADGSAWTTTCIDNFRVTRGGFWMGNPWDLRSAYRNMAFTDSRGLHLGLRIARNP